MEVLDRVSWGVKLSRDFVAVILYAHRKHHLGSDGMDEYAYHDYELPDKFVLSITRANT